MFSKFTSTIWISHRKYFLHNTVEEIPLSSGLLSSSKAMDHQLISERQTVVGYTAMSQKASLLCEGPCLCRSDGIMHQDNAAVHNTRRTNGYFMTDNVSLFEYPTFMFNQKPLEVVWRWISRKFYRNRRYFQTVHGLHEATLQRGLYRPCQSNFLKLFTVMAEKLATETSCRACSILFTTSFRLGSWTFDELVFSLISPYSNFKEKSLNNFWSSTEISAWVWQRKDIGFLYSHLL